MIECPFEKGHTAVGIINQFDILRTINEANVEGQLKILIQIFQGPCWVGNEKKYFMMIYLLKWCDISSFKMNNQ